MGDDRLAARAAKSDRQAFAELYRRHHQRLYRYCLSLVGNPEDAADALQTTMAKALSALESGDVVKGVRPWLFRISHNASIDLIRSRRPRTTLDELEEIGSSALTAPSAASEAHGRAELAEVVADIRDLPDRQASALVMRELSELSYGEIAGALDTSQLAARQLVHQARSLLHDNRNGRDMDCEAVRRGLGATDGKRPRDRRMRAHLAECRSCAAFGRSIRRRRSALAALAPPLAPAAGGEILARLLESSSSTGAGAAAGGTTAATAGFAKLAGASGISKVAGAVAGGAAAVAVAGGAVVVGGALLGPEEVSSRSSPPASAEARLEPDLPALRALPKPFARPAQEGRRAERRADGGPSSGARSAPAASRSSSISPREGEPTAPTGPSGGGLPPVALGDGDPPVDLGDVVDRRGDGLGLGDTGGSGVEAPDLPDDVPEVPVDLPAGIPGSADGGTIELPGRSEDAEVAVPEVEVLDVDVPEVEIREIDVPSSGSVDAPDTGSVESAEADSVDVPDADSVEVPRAGLSEASGSGPGAPDL